MDRNNNKPPRQKATLVNKSSARSDCSSSNRSRMTTRSVAMTVGGGELSSLRSHRTSSSNHSSSTSSAAIGGNGAKGNIFAAAGKHYTDPLYGSVDPCVLADRALAKTEKHLRENVQHFSALKVSVQRCLAEIAKESSVLYYAIEESRKVASQLTVEKQQHVEVLEEFQTLSNFAHGSPTRLHEESNQRQRERNRAIASFSSTTSTPAATPNSTSVTTAPASFKGDMTFHYGTSSKFSRRHQQQSSDKKDNSFSSTKSTTAEDNDLLVGDHAVFSSLPKLEETLLVAEGLADEGEAMRTEMALLQRRVQHLAHLVDRSVENELQCLHSAVYSRPTSTCASKSNSVSPSVANNNTESEERRELDLIGSAILYSDASPLFPQDSLQDAQGILDRATEICLASGRLTNKLHSVSRASAEILASSAVELKRLLKKSLLIAETKLNEAKRHVLTVEAEEKKTQYRKQKHLSKVEELQRRSEAIEKAICVRKTALQCHITSTTTATATSSPVSPLSAGGASSMDSITFRLTNDNVLQSLQEEHRHVQDALNALLDEVGALRQMQRKLKSEKRSWNHVLDGAQSKSDVCQSFREPSESPQRDS